MALRLHHLFVCASVGAPEAADLSNAGLVEGSSNTHPGQGTANRRFFFDSGMLELIWVHDEREAQSTLAAPTRLWDRWVERGRAANPFGICLSSADAAVSALPFPCWAYRPDYLPDGRCFLFADKLHLSEPEVFVMSWPQGQSSPATEPTTHPLGLRKMRSVSVGLPDPTSISGTMLAISEAAPVTIHRSAAPELVIEFTSEKEVQYRVPALGLTLVGHRASA